MDTRLAKNYLILFLLILNIILFSISLLIKDKYNVTKESEQSIINYIEKRNISLKTALPKKYPPMLNVNMTKSIYDEKFFTNMFFDINKNINKAKKNSDIFYTQDEKMLIINANYVLFQDAKPIKNFKNDKKSCENIIKKYKNKLEKKYGKMHIDSFVKEKNIFSINYIQKINGYKIFNNMLSFNVYENGSFNMYFNNYTDAENTGVKKNIYSPVEALYTFAREIKNLITDDHISIIDLDLGYYLTDIEDSLYSYLTPYYRIFVEDIPSPFYINSYTNEFEYGVKTNMIALTQ